MHTGLSPSSEKRKRKEPLLFSCSLSRSLGSLFKPFQPLPHGTGLQNRQVHPRGLHALCDLAGDGKALQLVAKCGMINGGQ
mmetsp:Transcript_19960/g.55528  ORF Transcript_19960/g.55528 Transcript_19960/m.55528 type:complete len:81 (-) Transcript_19960:1180-1422(-)